MDKKGFTLIELLGVIILLGIIVGISFPLVNNTIKSSKQNAFLQTKESILDAAYNYSVNNDLGYSEDLHKLELEQLKKDGLIESHIINPITKKEMNGCVVYRWNQNYNSYEFEYEELCSINSLIELLMNQYKGLKSNDENSFGLIQDSFNSNNYYFKGSNEVVKNNYLWYGGHNWRILGFDTDKKTIKLITQASIVSTPYSDKIWNNGLEYKNTYINKWLNGINENKLMDGYFYNNLSDDVKKNIVPNDFKIVIPEKEETPSGNSLIKIKNNVGLLDVFEYERTKVNQKSFLNIQDTWWLENKYNDREIYAINTFNSLTHRSSKIPHGLRPVIVINDINVTKGDGSIDNYYQTDLRKKQPINLNSGEYVKLKMKSNRFCKNGDCLFRIVENNNGVIKIILNGLVLENSTFGKVFFDVGFASNKDTKNSLIYKEKLYPFINDIDISSQVFIEKKFYIGDAYPYIHDSVEKGFLEEKIGLPVIGEMFTGNDIGLGNSNLLNKNIIEGFGISDTFWTMNKGSGNSLYIQSDSYITDASDNLSDVKGVRPVIYIDGNKIAFKSGDGSPNNPYILISK